MNDCTFVYVSLINGLLKREKKNYCIVVAAFRRYQFFFLFCSCVCMLCVCVCAVLTFCAAQQLQLSYAVSVCAASFSYIQFFVVFNSLLVRFFRSYELLFGSHHGYA